MRSFKMKKYGIVRNTDDFLSTSVSSYLRSGLACTDLHSTPELAKQASPQRNGKKLPIFEIIIEVKEIE